jgi:sporulation protein YlmC with PRC-barrel domain
MPDILDENGYHLGSSEDLLLDEKANKVEEKVVEKEETPTIKKDSKKK